MDPSISSSPTRSTTPDSKRQIRNERRERKRTTLKTKEVNSSPQDDATEDGDGHEDLLSQIHSDLKHLMQNVQARALPPDSSGSTRDESELESPRSIESTSSSSSPRRFQSHGGLHKEMLTKLSSDPATLVQSFLASQPEDSPVKKNHARMALLLTQSNQVSKW
jgi:hypothetical protein